MPVISTPAPTTRLAARPEGPHVRRSERSLSLCSHLLSVRRKMDKQGAFGGQFSDFYTKMYQKNKLFELQNHISPSACTVANQLLIHGQDNRIKCRFKKEKDKNCSLNTTVRSCHWSCLLLKGAAFSKQSNIKNCRLILLVLFICSSGSDSLPPYGLQHTRLLCPSLTPRVCSTSCSLS